MWFTVLFCILAYGIGSISSAVLVCRCMGLPDPRAAGSKNPGATNVLRFGNKKAAFLTLLGDAFKGFIPVWAAVQLNPVPDFVGPIMLAVLLGHLYPLFFKFQGGKGVATSLGMMCALWWPIGVMLIGTWGVVAVCSRLSSLAALVAAVLAPLYTAWWLNQQFAIPVIAMSVLLFWKHRSNIQRLLAGTESKMGN